MEPRADILGKLFVIQDAVQVLPSEASTAAFLGRALGEVPGVVKVCACLRGVLYPPDPALADTCLRFAAIADTPASIGPREFGAVPGTELVPFATARHLYGFLALGLGDAAAFAPYAAFIKNIASVVAIYLEAHDNLAEIESAKSELELRVARRTSELNEQNALLRVEIDLRKKVEQAVRETAIEIEDLYNNAPCGYQSVDKDGLIVRINDTELAWLSYAREEVVGKKRIFDLWSPAAKSIYEKAFLKLKGQGRIIDEELGMVRKDGTAFPVLLTETAVTDRAGNFVMTRGIVQDITERKRAYVALRESKAAMADTIVTAMTEGVMFLSASGTIMAANPAAERILGVSPEKLLGRRPDTIPWRCIHEDGTSVVPESHPAMVSLRTGQPLRDVVMGICKSEVAPTWISINSQPLLSEKRPIPYAVITTFRDITKQKQEEQKHQLADREIPENGRKTPQKEQIGAHNGNGTSRR